MQRCPWCLRDPLYIEYHDREWGVAVYEDQKLFEFLVLEGMQAGLSWLTILKKRSAFHAAFHFFDVDRVARFTEKDLERAIAVPGILKHKKKLASAVNNARHFLEIQEKQGSFSSYIWQFVEGAPKRNAWGHMGDVPCLTPESEKMAKELRQKGFQFIGPKICYSFMQAVGMVNDHLVTCFRHRA